MKMTGGYFGTTPHASLIAERKGSRYLARTRLSHLLSDPDAFFLYSCFWHHPRECAISNAIQ